MISHIEYVPKIVYDVRYTVNSNNEIIGLPNNFEELVKGYTWSLNKSELAFKYLCQQNKIKKGKFEFWQEAFSNFKGNSYCFIDHNWDDFEELMGK